MNKERKIQVEEVEQVTPPPRARVNPPPSEEGDHAQHGGGGVESAAEKLGRKRDYLAGFLAGETESAPASADNDELKDRIVEALKSVYDPEIPVDIYELGLIYDIDVSEDGDAIVTMTLTTPHCPVAETLPNEVELRVLSVPGVRDAEVRLVWDPPWDPSKMSDEARLELGML